MEALMSWVRWGSKCDQGYPFRQSACSAAPAECLGSFVYVWESAEGFECGCGFDDATAHWTSFKCQTKAEMIAHLKAHVARGDHSLLEPLDDEETN
jgi:hypothetical protein